MEGGPEAEGDSAEGQNGNGSQNGADEEGCGQEKEYEFTSWENRVLQVATWRLLRDAAFL